MRPFLENENLFIATVNVMPMPPNYAAKVCFSIRYTNDKEVMPLIDNIVRRRLDSSKR